MNTRAGIFRALVVMAAAVGVVNPRLPSLGPPPPPVLVVDVSASVSGGAFGPPAWDWDAVALPWYAVADGVVARDARGGAPGLGRDATRLGAGLAEVVQRHPGRVVWLVTDGRATDQGAEDAARRLRASGGRLDVSPPDPAPADVALVLARARRRAAGGAVVHVRLGASTGGEGRVALSRDGRSIVQRDVRVESGAYEDIDLEDADAPAGPLAYRVRWTPAPGTPDDQPGNDELALGLRPERSAVLVWGDLPPGAWSGPDVPFRLRRMPSFEPGALEAADLVVLSDLSWPAVGAAHAEDVLRFAAGGGHVLLLGGPHAWRAGGWGGTLLEDELSPLLSPTPDGTDLAIVFALDHSGSTADGALAPLTHAVAEALGTLQPGERMAVLPFAAAPAPALLAPGWVAGGENAKRDALVRAVGALEAGGSTDLVAALAAAGRHVATAPARRRRVLLLTDGDPDREPDPVALGRLARGLEAQGVRFRAVVSGSAALAKRLSDGLGAKPGEVVELPDAGRIPRALLRVLAEARSRGERLGPPASITWVGGAPGPLAGLAPAWVHAVDAAPSAQVLAVAAWADGQTARPFAARRDVGAGAVFALAWGPAAEPTRREASASLARLVPWISDLAGSADRGLFARIQGDQLVVEIPEARAAGRVRVDALGQTAWLVEEAPGRFRGPLPCECRRGVRVRVSADPPRWRAVDLPALAAAELRGAGVDVTALDALARAGGGRVLAAGEAPARLPAPSGPPLGPAFLVLAVVVLVLERARAGRRPAARSAT